MQWQYLQTEYSELKKQISQKSKLKRQKQTCEQQIDSTKEKIEKHEQQLNQIRKQLEKDGKFSFISFVRSLTGKKQRLMEERLTTAMTEELKLVEAQLTLEDLQNDFEKISSKLNALEKANLSQRLVEVENLKREWLMDNAPSYAIRLNEIMEERAELSKLIIEIEEAIDAAKQAKDILYKVLEQLSKAKSYSTWDTFLGGEFIATYLKHDKLKSTEVLLHKAQMALQRFYNELSDIETTQNEVFKIDIGEFVKMADYFFDDIFSEWSIHSKIKTKLVQVQKILDDVSNTELFLKQKLALTTDGLNTLKQEEEKIYMLEDSSLFL